MISTSVGKQQLIVDMIACLQRYDGTSSTSMFSGETIAGYGAYGCFSQETPVDLFHKDVSDLHTVDPQSPIGKDRVGDLMNNVEAKMKKIFEETAGRGHGAVLDQSQFTYNINNLPRSATLFLCQLPYLAHLQQSLRRASAERGFYIPDSIDRIMENEIIDIGKPTPAWDWVKIQNKSFDLYNEMVEAKIPTEDARYILPLNTLTNIQTSGNARELMHLDYMSSTKATPTIVKEIVGEMMKEARDESPHMMEYRENSYEVKAWYPAEQLFAESNKTMGYISDSFSKNRIVNMSKSTPKFTKKMVTELVKSVKNGDEGALNLLKHYHFTFFAEMSLSSFHQAIRQRTWDISCETIYNAVRRRSFTIPPSIENTEFEGKFKECQNNMIKAYYKLIEAGIDSREAIGCIPHSLNVGTVIHINGWNAIHSIAKRTCTKAQWDIRRTISHIADVMCQSEPILGMLIGPQCKVYQRCPEAKSCGLLNKYLEK